MYEDLFQHNHHLFEPFVIAQQDLEVFLIPLLNIHNINDRQICHFIYLFVN
jgi:hypothetical protein